MADTKISALTSATTPLAGTEVLPIVQSGATVKVPVSSLTAGRDVSTNNINMGAIGTVTQLLGGMQNTNWRIREKSQVDWCAWTTNINDAGTQDDASKSSWMTQQGFGGGNDRWRVGRWAAGSSSLVEFVVIDNTGNIIPKVAAKGIDFSANTPAAGKTSTLLNWYEEGTWTPSVSSTSGSITTVGTVIGRYTRIGRCVQVSFDITITTN